MENEGTGSLEKERDIEGSKEMEPLIFKSWAKEKLWEGNPVSFASSVPERGAELSLRKRAGWPCAPAPPASHIFKLLLCPHWTQTAFSKMQVDKDVRWWRC